MGRPDFGKHRVTVADKDGRYPIELECNYQAPGLTMQDLMRVFSEAKAQAKPGDEFAGNPSRWPDVRGINAVKEAILDAIYGPEDASPKVPPESHRQDEASNAK